MKKQYVKGFILDRHLVAKILEAKHATNPEVNRFIHTVVRGLNCDGYKFIGTVYRHKSDPMFSESKLALAIVLEVGCDEEALKRMELPPLDDTIAAAQPHVLIGPDVWELWG